VSVGWKETLWRDFVVTPSGKRETKRESLEFANASIVTRRDRRVN
jgi:hypothetical protein